MKSPIKKGPDIRAFVQHGFLEQGTAGNNVSGRCPFCGKDKHFYVNGETRKWDCKRCGKNGGFQTFLDEVYKMSIEAMTEDKLKEVAQSRGLSLGTLESFGLGYNPNTDAFLIPVWSADKARIWDLRIFRDGKILNTASCQAGLFNWWDPGIEEKLPIYLCEGEWDGMAMWEIIGRRKKNEGIVLSVPGAGTFKAEWTAMFRDKKVFVMFDKDKAGVEGMIKVFNNLSSITAELKFIHWPDGLSEGFDIRDLYVKQEKRNSNTAWKLLHDYLQDMPPMFIPAQEAGAGQTASKSTAVKKSYAPKLDGEGLTPEEVYKAYRKWLHLPDPLILDFMFGLTIANRSGGNPLWGQIVGPSGATKTELLVSLDDSPFIATITSITPHALISGANFAGGGDPSLIPKWDGKVVIIKDLTVLLTLNQTHRDEIFSIFRDAYDGKTEKSFGNGVIRSYKVRFGMLAGVTPVIEIFGEEHTSLGERWLRFPVTVPDSLLGKLDFARRAVKNVSNNVMEQMRSELRETAKKVLSRKFDWEITVPDRIQEKLLHAAQLVALLRSTIKRDYYTKEISHKPFSEMATRLTQQLQMQLTGTAHFRGVEIADDATFEVIKRISQGTIPSKFNDILTHCHKKGKDKFYSLADMMAMTKLPQGTIQRTVDGMAMLDMFQKRPGINGLKAEYRMSPDLIMLIENSGIYS